MEEKLRNYIELALTFCPFSGSIDEGLNVTAAYGNKTLFIPRGVFEGYYSGYQRSNISRESSARRCATYVKVLYNSWISKNF